MEAPAKPTPVLFGASPNEAGWQAAIFTVRAIAGGRLPAAASVSRAAASTPHARPPRPAPPARAAPRALARARAAAVLTPPATTATHPAPQVVHRLGRHFGFQAFNLDPRTEVRARRSRSSCRHRRPLRRRPPAHLPSTTHHPPPPSRTRPRPPGRPRRSSSRPTTSTTCS